MVTTNFVTEDAQYNLVLGFITKKQKHSILLTEQTINQLNVGN